MWKEFLEHFCGIPDKRNLCVLIFQRLYTITSFRKIHILTSIKNNGNFILSSKATFALPFQHKKQPDAS